MKTTILTVILLISVAATAQDGGFGKPTTFPLEPNAKIVPSATGGSVAVTSKFSTEIYNLDGDDWMGPMRTEAGYLGSRNDPVRPGSWPNFGWAYESKTEMFVVSKEADKAVTITSAGLELIAATASIYDSFLDEVGRLRMPVIGQEAAFREAAASRYQELRGRDVSSTGFVSATKPDLPESLYAIADFSPRGDRVLGRPSEDDPLLSLNLLTGERTVFAIQKHPGVSPSGMSGSFSLDGAYVIVQFSYGPDDHYAGGFLQLFKSDGTFIEEVAEFSKDAPQPTGFHEWLATNWLVYSTGEEICFRKFQNPTP